MPRKLLLAYIFLTKNTPHKKGSALTVYKNFSILDSITSLKGLYKEKESCFNKHLSKLIDDIKTTTQDINAFDQEIIEVQKKLLLTIPIKPIEAIIIKLFLF